MYKEGLTWVGKRGEVGLWVCGVGFGLVFSVGLELDLYRFIYCGRLRENEIWLSVGFTLNLV